MIMKVLTIFQFHKGTIWTPDSSFRAQTSMDFNSIKVQFEPSTYILYAPTQLFQFHKGTIWTILAFATPTEGFVYFNSIKVQFERCSVWAFTAWKWLFQFHKGTIWTAVSLVPWGAISHFNSIKVQFELQETTTQPLTLIFQFHKGTIWTYVLHPACCQPPISIP